LIVISLSTYKDLKVWEKSRLFIKEIYLTTADFPNEEIFGIVSQLRRASISISNNIAEGSGRESKKDFSRFLTISYSSAVEVENLLIISNDLEMINEYQFENLYKKIEEIQKMIFALRKSIIQE